MPFSGGTFSRTDGTRTGSTVWTQARDAGVKIVSSGHDTHDQDIAGGLNALLLKNGENTPTANLPMATKKHTGVGNGTARTDYLAVGQLQDGAVNYAAATVSSSNVYVATLAPAVTAYTTGMMVHLEFAAINTASATINLNCRWNHGVDLRRHRYADRGRQSLARMSGVYEGAEPYTQHDDAMRLGFRR